MTTEWVMVVLRTPSPQVARSVGLVSWLAPGLNLVGVYLWFRLSLRLKRFHSKTYAEVNRPSLLFPFGHNPLRLMRFLLENRDRQLDDPSLRQICLLMRVLYPVCLVVSVLYVMR
jgi:hypothetical protein